MFAAAAREGHGTELGLQGGSGMFRLMSNAWRGADSTVHVGNTWNRA